MPIEGCRLIVWLADYTVNNTDATSTDYTDPLADITTCNRDIPYLVQLSTNVIRTYAIDPTNDHSACMNALAAAGIYVITDMSAPDVSINRNDPGWSTALYNRYTAVIDDMSQYNNVIGFFAGNEVSNSYNTTPASAFVKAAVRDSKAYIKAQGYRNMYVGYATYDGDIRDQLADYFNCGDQDDAIDFWGYNVYSWCGDSSYTLSGYDERTAFFQNYSVPAFFAEYGCNTVQPRTFTEVQALYGSEMTGVWSGGIVYMYFQETNNYGMSLILLERSSCLDSDLCVQVWFLRSIVHQSHRCLILHLSLLSLHRSRRQARPQATIPLVLSPPVHARQSVVRGWQPTPPCLRHRTVLFAIALETRSAV